ncbi:MAG: hypothetical protein QOF55_2100 [Thermoleophilaceae bacterium]|nr:hypothetical protein [Thermoleophilaceae bacterium]
MPRLPLVALAVSLALLVSVTAQAPAAGPGGWDHLGTGSTPTTGSLNGAVRSFDTHTPGVLYAGGAFTDAGGNPNADHIAAWDGTAWSAVGSPPLTGDVNAIVSQGGKIYAGGTFTNAGGNPNADFLAVWDGTSWAPFCSAPSGPAFGGNVDALQIIGSTLWVGGEYQNGGGIATADYLLGCDLATGASRSPYTVDGHGSGAVYALTADSSGNLYTGGTGINIAGIPEADHVARFDGSAWHAMGSGPPPGNGAVPGIVRSLGSNGSDVYVGTDATDVATIPQADNVVKWDGTAWSAMGSNTAGTDGWFPPSTSINAITTSGSTVFAAGSFQNANGDPVADQIASFDGSAWHAVGSDGAGNGPLNANGQALSVFGGSLYAGGSFTSAGGDRLAEFAARYPLTAGPLPPPVEGKTVNAVPEKGTVLVKVPAGAGAGAAKAAGFVPLGALGRQLPVGSTLDTTHGTVKLSSATNSSGATQDGHFSQGQFKVLQTAKNQLTTLAMAGGGGLSACSKLPPGGSPKVRARSLFSNVKGRFRTRGRNSTATVRGTQYLVKDTCAGTLTKVKVGKVVVRDLALKKTKTLKAGQSYFARALKRR